jgi:hypothetical protein
MQFPYFLFMHLAFEGFLCTSSQWKIKCWGLYIEFVCVMKLFMILSLLEFASTKYHLQLSFLEFFPSSKYKCYGHLHFLPFSFNYRKCKKFMLCQMAFFSPTNCQHMCNHYNDHLLLSNSKVQVVGLIH